MNYASKVAKLTKLKGTQKYEQNNTMLNQINKFTNEKVQIYQGDKNEK